MNGEFRLGTWLVQPRLNTLVCDGQSARVEPKVMQVLVCLARGAGDVVEKEAIIRDVWADTFVSDDALIRCISELRKIFGDDAREARFIQTIPKIGYRLVIPVEEPVMPSNGHPTTAGPSDDAPPAAVRTAAPSTSTYQYAPWIITALVLGAALAAAIWSHRQSFTSAHESFDSIAVLPFSNGTADPAVDYISDGIALSVTNGLSRVPHLKVISQASTSYYRGQRINPPQVGAQLGVQALVTGRVVKKAEALLINVELVNARDDRHLWGAEYERAASDVLALEEEIGRDIIANLPAHPAESAPARARRLDTNSEAHQLYLQGRYLWNLRTPDGIRKSLDYFQQAVAKDPTDALAYTGLADAYDLMSEYNSVPPNECFPKGEAAARKALALDDSLAEAHTSLAEVKCMYDWDTAGAEREFRRAIALDPNYATAHQWYSHLLESLGRNDEARRELQRAVELDPLSLIINTNLAEVESEKKNPDSAEKIIRKLIDLYPNSPLTYANLGGIHLKQKNCSAALADFERARELGAAPVDALIEMGKVYSHCGQKAKAREVASQLETLSAKQYVAPSVMVYLYANLGDRDRAFDWLQKGVAARDDGIVHTLKDDSCANLRQDPRFAGVVQQIKPLS